MQYFEEHWEGTMFAAEAGRLMDTVWRFNMELSRFHDPEGGTNDNIRADGATQRRKRELVDQATDLRERCEREIAVRRAAMDDPTFRYSEDQDRYQDIWEQAAQIEKLEYALVRMKAAQDMLKSVPS